MNKLLKKNINKIDNNSRKNNNKIKETKLLIANLLQQITKNIEHTFHTFAHR